ncbi:hypothetical protein KJ059_01315 [Myxococcota bacterium]|nr:hypothetical protein [Myxococcota bacterium]MCZ7618297.1 hypothetical protein [Myxococcota bacterium]
MTRNFFSYDKLALRYDPFPIGLARPLIEDGLYRELVDAFPGPERFADLSKVGDKLSLSEKFGAEEFHAFIRSHPLWREFHAYIKSKEFIAGVLEALRERSIDLGFELDSSPGKRISKRLADAARGGSRTDSLELRARFEFSTLPARGGHVLPHTDGVSKFVTLVVSMLREGEWDPAWGGGTDINRPKDPTLLFNRLNRQLPFDAVEVLDSFPFEPNQAVIFVKTFNSWHSVRPMTAPDRSILRRTLTINIETPT